MSYHLTSVDYHTALQEARAITDAATGSPVPWVPMLSITHLLALQQRVDELENRVLSSKSCPCEWTTPCSSQCSCAHSYASGGCTRCCKYGSDAQRQAAAEDLARRLE